MTGQDVAAWLHEVPWLGLLAAALAAVAVQVLLGGPDGSEAVADSRRPAHRSGPPTPPAAADRSRGARALGSTGGGQRQASVPEVSSALALLALAYRSGLPTWDVLDAVARGTSGRVAADLQQVGNALRWGGSESEAWASVGPVWAPAARAVAIAHQAGVPPGSMLLAAADDLRGAELERLEVSAAKVGVRLVAPLGLVLLPAFCLTTVAPLVIALAGDLLKG